MASPRNSDQPKSLLDGVEASVSGALSITSLRHRSAVLKLPPFDGRVLVAGIFETIRHNYLASNATTNKDRSKQNWRWHSLQPQIAAHNRSPEVVIERAIAAACVALNRTDWANQIPVASGLVEGAGDGRRAIDLVRRHDENHFELIELKIASDNPLYAAVEIVGYACLWLLARSDRPGRSSAMLDAERIDLTVLAPEAYYGRFPLADIESSFDEGVRALGSGMGVTMSFGFRRLDDSIDAGNLLAPRELLDRLEHSLPACLT
ncbi:MAG: hypothetical protein WCL10_08015 [Novosphingobium sp.]|jgi:hypothetical protein|uniref:hypothetical protein n=1 Tax=Novosphingobium sp. TaxID=1874826 RepID=UPI0030195E35